MRIVFLKTYPRSIIEWFGDMLDSTVCRFANETHVPDPEPDPAPPMRATVTYRGGSLREVMVDNVPEGTSGGDILHVALAAAGLTPVNVWETRVIPQVERGLVLVRLWTD